MKIIFPNIRIERWKYNKEYEVYVSNMGHFRNKSKGNIAPMTTSGGYLSVLCKGSEVRFVLAHRLVMLTWRPTAEAEHLTVDHLNHNKHDNSLGNLEWVSKEVNQQRAKDDRLTAKKAYDEMLAAALEKANNCADKRVVALNIKNPNLKPVIIRPDFKDIENIFTIMAEPNNADHRAYIVREIERLFDGTNNHGRKRLCGVQLILVQENNIYGIHC